MKSTIRRILREQYGEGHDECGIIYYDSIHDDNLIGYSNLRDSVVNYPEETLELIKKDKETIPINQTLYSTQDYIDLDYVYGLNDEVYKQSDIHLLDINGDLFIMDGHHRICRDRMSGRDSQAYIWDNNDMELIDCIFYGIGDC
tara:strand:- start:3707 stop:4138 length:432 start_codon:yes stop_codon:yes gene_type:complete